MLRSQFLFALATLAPLAVAAQEHYVLFRAQPALAEITGSETREKNLPTLNFPFRLDAACSRPAILSGLSLNVADIRQTWSTDQPAITIEESLVVPASQTAPVMANFCIDGKDDGMTQLIRSVFTAQLALTCSAEDARSIEYQSVALDVELACLQPALEASPDESVSPSEESLPPDDSTSS